MEKIVRIYSTCISLFKIASLLTIILFLPQLFVWNCNKQCYTQNNQDFKLGIENISTLSLPGIIKHNAGVNIALITNQIDKLQPQTNAIHMLCNKGFNIKKILVPLSVFESTQTRSHISQIRNSFTHTIIPLEYIESNAIHTTTFKDIDIVMFDVQDIGMCHNGQLNTLLHTMKTLQKEHKKLILFDRPNILGWCMEGTSIYCAEDTHNFNSISIPLRHGMTLGEIATYFNKYVLHKPVDLHVIPMNHYERQNTIDSSEPYYNYSFLSLLSYVKPFDIGLGTDKAFQCILLPEHLKISKNKWRDLRILLKEHGIESKHFRCFNATQHIYYSGLHLSVQDINRFSSFNTFLDVLTFFKSAGLQLTFSPTFDKTVGSDKVRNLLLGNVSHVELACAINNKLHQFYKKAFSCFLYKPYPKIITL